MSSALSLQRSITASIMSKNYRARWHDYTSRCIYHITLMKGAGMPPFGYLAGDCSLPVGTPGSSNLRASRLGRAVKETLREVATIHPALQVYQYALMPDHLHLVLNVSGPLDEILGRKIGRFKNLVNVKAGCTGVFADGFNDQILKPARSLNAIYRYLRENPYRLAVRRANPDFFQRRDELTIGGASWRAYGNIQLLDNPFKEQVVVHRADTPEQFTRQKEEWLHTAANGGVLVSPFISGREREVRKEAEALGARLILITNAPFGEREKPAAHDFALCAEGRLLIIAPPKSKNINRAVCMKMNALAAQIADVTRT